MNPHPQPFFKRLLTWVGTSVGLLWGGAIALLADSAFPDLVWVDFGIRAFVMVTMTLLGAGLGRLCGWGIDAVRRRCKRP